MHARLVEGVAAWVTPKRLIIYPAAIVLSVMLSRAWVYGSAIASGVPFFLTVGQDFKGYYTGGRFWVEGRLAELYDVQAQQEIQASLAIPGNKLLPFIHPPFTVVLWAPFAMGSYPAGLLGWWAAGLLALTASLYLLRQELLRPHQVSMGRLLLLSFLFYPTLAWFLYAQNTALTLLLYTLTLVWLRQGRDFAAGAALGLLLYKPQLAIALGVMLAVKWRWRALLGGGLSAGLWLAVGFALSPTAMGEYARVSSGLLNLLVSSGGPDSKAWAVNTFYAFAVLLLGGLWPTGANMLGTLLTAGGLIGVVVWWRRTAWRPGAYAWDFMLAATLALGLLISPYVFVYDLMLLLAPLAIVWSHYPHGAGGRHLDGGRLLAWTALLYGATFASTYLAAAQVWLAAVLGLPQVALQISVPVIAGWAWVVTRSAQGSTISPTPALSSG